MRWSSTAWESRLVSGADDRYGRRGGAQDAAAWVRGAGGCRRPRAAQRAEGEGARALPETGSEVLGTQRGTRPRTGPLSTANSSSGKCEPGGDPGPGRGGAAEAGIFGSAWPRVGRTLPFLLRPRRRGPQSHWFLLSQVRPRAGGARATRPRPFRRRPMAVLDFSSSQSGLSAARAERTCPTL